MSHDLTIPRSTVYQVKRRNRGAPVYAIQRAVNRLDYGEQPIVEDGVFGAMTENRVVQFQHDQGLGADGVVGPKTSAALSREAQDDALAKRRLPGGITFAIANLESSNLVGAVNWSVAGGVDCSVFQRRVLAPYRADDVLRAFDIVYQAKLLVSTLRGRHDTFYRQVGAKTHERAWRLAVLHHNYPAAASRIASVGIGGLTSYWTTTQSWVTQHQREFADGAPVRTPLDWCKHYALGAPDHEHEGVAVRGVTGWSTA